VNKEERINMIEKKKKFIGRSSMGVGMEPVRLKV
jgi:hypothetical protein